MPLGPFLDPRRSDLMRRLAIFSAGRAVVFTVVVALALFVLLSREGALAFSYSPKVLLLVLLLAYASAGLQWWSSRHPEPGQNVALSLLVVDQGLFAGIAFVTGGISSGVTSLFGVTCLAGGLLLGIPGAVVATLAGGVCFSLMVLTTQGGEGLFPPDQPAHLYALAPGQAAYYYSFNVLMLLLVGLLSSYLAERLQRAGGELRAAHRRVAQAERMAELGRLAAGLAHEIRNPLSSISGSVQMLRSGAERAEDRELCEIVLRESKRLDDLVTDMVDLSRPRQPQLAETNVSKIAAEVVLLAGQSGRGTEDVSIVFRGPSEVVVSADPAQIRQLVWNLVRNAVQASSAGGEVRVILESEESVRLSVEDDGVGIDSHAKEMLFDAFFTTRSQGTGLGLALVKKIADEHGFDVDVFSEHGSGARFTVHLGPTLGSAARQRPAP